VAPSPNSQSQPTIMPSSSRLASWKTMASPGLAVDGQVKSATGNAVGSTFTVAYRTTVAAGVRASDTVSVTLYVVPATPLRRLA
jgi:hypothetical protein